MGFKSGTSGDFPSVSCRTYTAQLRDYTLPNDFIALMPTCLCIRKFRRRMRFGTIGVHGYQHVRYGPQLPSRNCWFAFHFDTTKSNRRLIARLTSAAMVAPVLVPTHRPFGTHDSARKVAKGRRVAPSGRARSLGRAFGYALHWYRPDYHVTS